jgi:hypothetical protein
LSGKYESPIKTGRSRDWWLIEGLEAFPANFCHPGQLYRSLKKSVDLKALVELAFRPAS